ncbi:MAG: hypothetical protein HC915_16875, partial [Anaerolineae bacterium]|nr:hypothetical protein [Anaerolineae bacterium]
SRWPLEALLPALAGQLGIQDLETVIPLETEAGYTWSIFPAEVQGFSVYLALTDSLQDATVYIVALQAPAEDLDALYESTLLPVLQNFSESE